MDSRRVELSRRWRHDGAWRRLVLGVALAMLVGLGVRMAFVLFVQDDVVLADENGLRGDAAWYHYQAQLVADGKGFLHPFEYFEEGREAPGADHPPGFVLILASLDLVGVDTPQGQRLAMCLLGTVTIGLVALLGHRLGGRRTALISAFLAALYPNLWINDGMLMAETPFLAATALALLCAYAYLDRPGWVPLLGLTIGITGAALTRPEAAVLFAVLVAPLVLWRRSLPWGLRFRHLLVAAAVPVVAYGPWVAYNMGRFQEPVLISTGAGQTLAVGNCDLTYSGDFLGFYNINCLLPPQIDPPTDPDPSVRDPQYRAIAREYISEHRDELPKVMSARVGRLWHVFRVEQGLTLDGWIEGRAGGQPGDSLRIVREALWSYYALMPLAIAGAVVLRRRRTALYPLLTQPALATFTAATTFGVTRYRAGAELVLVVLAAVAVDALLRGRRAASTVGDDETRSDTPHDPRPDDVDTAAGADHPAPV